jgi:uncharacterized Zn finger protein (UPF0148 family)
MINIAQHCDKCKNVTSHTLKDGVIVCLKCKKQTKIDENVNELWEGWEDYNVLQEHEKDPCDVNEFVKWFNYHYVTQIEVIDIDFIQL